jgi:hypothetical protein
MKCYILIIDTRMSDSTLISSMHSILSSLTTKEESRRNLSYLYQRQQRQQQQMNTGVTIIPPITLSNNNHSMKMLRRKIDNMVRKENLSKKFKKELKCSESLQQSSSTDLCDFHKPWLSLTNDERANRINEYVLRTYNDKTTQGKARYMLMKGITGKLLEQTSVTYDTVSSTISDIPCLQYNDPHAFFYFL